MTYTAAERAQGTVSLRNALASPEQHPWLAQNPRPLIDALLNEPALVSPAGFFKGRDATIVTAGVLDDAFVLSLSTRVLEMPVSAYAKPSAQVDDPASSNADVQELDHLSFEGDLVYLSPDARRLEVSSGAVPEKQAPGWGLHARVVVYGVPYSEAYEAATLKDLFTNLSQEQPLLWGLFSQDPKIEALAGLVGVPVFAPPVAYIPPTAEDMLRAVSINGSVADAESEYGFEDEDYGALDEEGLGDALVTYAGASQDGEDADDGTSAEIRTLTPGADEASQ